MFLGASRQTGVHMVARLDIGMDGIRGMSCVIFNIPILALSDRIRIQMEKVATYAVILVHHAHSSTLLENNLSLQPMHRHRNPAHVRLNSYFLVSRD